MLHVPFYQIAAGNILNACRQIARNADNAEGRPCSLSRDYVHSHKTRHYTVKHAYSQTEHRDEKHIPDIVSSGKEEKSQRQEGQCSRQYRRLYAVALENRIRKPAGQNCPDHPENGGEGDDL